jgi:hypothetical protein
MASEKSQPTTPVVEETPTKPELTPEQIQALEAEKKQLLAAILSNAAPMPSKAVPTTPASAEASSLIVKTTLEKPPLPKANSAPVQAVLKAIEEAAEKEKQALLKKINDDALAEKQKQVKALEAQAVSPDVLAGIADALDDKITRAYSATRDAYINRVNAEQQALREKVGSLLKSVRKEAKNLAALVEPFTAVMDKDTPDLIRAGVPSYWLHSHDWANTVVTLRLWSTIPGRCEEVLREIEQLHSVPPAELKLAVNTIIRDAQALAGLPYAIETSAKWMARILKEMEPMIGSLTPPATIKLVPIAETAPVQNKYVTDFDPTKK